MASLNSLYWRKVAFQYSNNSSGSNRSSSSSNSNKKVTWNNNNKRSNSIFLWQEKTENLFKLYANKQLILAIHNLRMDKHYTHMHMEGKVFNIDFFIPFSFRSISSISNSLVFVYDKDSVCLFESTPSHLNK